MTFGANGSRQFWRLHLVGALMLLAVTSAAAQRPESPPPDSISSPDTTVLSARAALLKSLVLPGWGQAYVGAHGRGALYFGMEAGSLWMVYKSSRGLSSARQLESFLRENDALAEGSRLPLAESRAQQVEDWITMSIFLALFAGADAYVSAQLADFPGHVGAAPAPGGAVRFQVQLDVGGPR